MVHGHWKGSQVALILQKVKRAYEAKTTKYEKIREKLVDNLAALRIPGVTMKATPRRHANLVILPVFHKEYR